MLGDTKAFSGFSVDDIPKARAFYADVLGITVGEANGMLTLHFTGDRQILVYPKGAQHTPATFTILNAWLLTVRLRAENAALATALPA